MDPNYICDCIRSFADEYLKEPDISISRKEFQKRSYAGYAIDCICKEIQSNSFYHPVRIVNEFSEQLLEFSEENEKNSDMFKIMYDVSCDVEEFLRAMC